MEIKIEHITNEMIRLHAGESKYILMIQKLQERIRKLEEVVNNGNRI